MRLLPCLSPFQSLLTATILVIVFLTLESSSLVSAATVPASDPCQLILQIMTPSSRNMSSIMRMCCVELRSSRRLVTKSVPRLPDPRENGLRRHWKLSSAGIGSGLGPGSRVPDPIDVRNIVFIELLERFQIPTFPMNLQPFAERDLCNTPYGAAKPSCVVLSL